MKKLIATIITVALALTLVFSLTACAEVENGSKIDRVKITLSFYDEEGVATDYDVYAKLYVNFAPNTVAHFEELVKNGYYSDAAVSNLTSTYFQFGDYALNADGTLQAKDQGKTVAGEFLSKGWKGNKLTVSQGALILKRENEGANGLSKYDTGKATIAVALSASAPFDAESYCVFGKIVNDDANTEADSSSAEYLSSLGRLLKISDQMADDDGRKLYYVVNDDTDVEDSADEEQFNWEGQYITYAEQDGEFAFFKGIYTAAQVAAGDANESMLTEEEQADFQSKLVETENVYTVPTLKVIVKSVTMVK